MRRWHVMLMIVITLAAFCVLASAKLRATPKYDRVQVGMPAEEMWGILRFKESPPILMDGEKWHTWDFDEGLICVRLERNDDDLKVRDKRLISRGPLERLAWLAGWR